MKKLISILVAFAMMMVLSVSAAFAADTAPGSETTPTDDQKSADAVIGKYLTVADGVTVPDVTFTFNFTPVASDTNNGGPAVNPAPTLTTAGQNPTLTDAAADDNSVAGSFSIADLFDDGEGGLIFTAPGEYIYTVAESNNRSTNTNSTTGVTETYTDDESEFTVRIYVKYDANGNLVIDTITIADEDGNKVNPTEDPTDDDFDPSDPEGATFVNNYEKSKAVDPDDVDPDNALLEVKKLVDGATDYIDPDQDFSFTINVSKPDNDTSDATTVTAYVYDNEEEELTGDTFTITYDADSEFTLKANQSLLFNTLPYGATYSVTEDITGIENEDNYTISATWDDGAALPGTKGDATLTVETGLVEDTDASNNVTYTNTLDADDVTPTGILMNNLPYIALALVAIGGLVAYVVVRRRQDDEA